MKTGGKVDELRDDMVTFEVLARSFSKSLISTHKNEPFNQDMHLKMLLSSRGFRLSKIKPGRRVSARYFFVRWIPPMAFWRRAHSCKGFFFSFLFFQDQPLFHCCKTNRGLILSRNSRTPKNDHPHISSLWYRVPTRTNIRTGNVWWWIS